MSNVIHPEAWWPHQQPPSPPPPPEPPMDTAARITKLEAVLPTLATREDTARELGALRTDMQKGFGELRVEMHKEFTAQTWRIMLAMLTFGAALASGVFFIARYVPIA